MDKETQKQVKEALKFVASTTIKALNLYGKRNSMNFIAPLIASTIAQASFDAREEQENCIKNIYERAIEALNESILVVNTEEPSAQELFDAITSEDEDEDGPDGRK